MNPGPGRSRPGGSGGSHPDGPLGLPGGPARVVLLALDGVGPERLDRSRTPVLAGMAGHVAGGLAGLPATTYPGFASLLTGCHPEHHLVRTTADRPGAVPGWAGQTEVARPTLLEAATAAGIRVAAVSGDHLLTRVLRTGRRGAAWPAGDAVGEEIKRDAHGYPTNVAVRGPALTAAAELARRPGGGLLFVHLNEVDTLGHDHGPAAAEVDAGLAATDALVGELLAALGPGWAETVVLVVSDHGMEARELGREPLLPHRAPGFGTVASDWIGDGGAAWVRLRPGTSELAAGAVLAGIEGVDGCSFEAGGRALLTAGPGRAFAPPWLATLLEAGGNDEVEEQLAATDARWRGIHGSARTARTVARVAGGHPVLARLAAEVARRPPRLVDWAPTIAGVLGFEMPGADGQDLLAPAEPA